MSAVIIVLQILLRGKLIKQGKHGVCQIITKQKKAKKMKKLNLILVGLMMCIFVQPVFSQDYGLKDGYFTTTIKSGVGQDVVVKFTISNENIELIKNHPSFKNWDSITFNNPKNSDFVQLHKSHSHLETYLYSTIGMASIWARLDLKNSQSFTPILNSEGFIYCKEDKINFSFPFQAQNGYGNMIFMKAYYSVKFENGKSVDTHFVM